MGIWQDLEMFSMSQLKVAALLASSELRSELLPLSYIPQSQDSYQNKE